MILKKIILAFVIVLVLSIFFASSSLQKSEMLELDCGSGNSQFIKFSLNGFNILTVVRKGSAFKNRLLCVTDKNLQLAGVMKCSSGEYAVAVLQNKISLYNQDGDTAECYSTRDSGYNILSCCISDIDGELDEELLVVEGDGRSFYGTRLVVLNYKDRLNKRYEREFKELNPWKVQTSDVDGDGRKEIALGVYKESYFHPVMAKRPFLYLWNREDIVPMWRGSRLSRPFDDYIFYDLDDDKTDELIAIERLQDGKSVINAYKWAGFGFESIAESSPYPDVLRIVRQYGTKESLLASVQQEGKCLWVELEKIGGQLVEKARFDKVLFIKK